MNYEWGPWIEHDGSGCPCEGQLVNAQYGGLPEDTFVAGSEARTGKLRRTHSRWHWAYPENLLPRQLHILRYRIRRPRVSEWLDQVTSDLPIEVIA